MNLIIITSDNVNKMTLELQIVKKTKSEHTHFVLVKYNGEINKQSCNFNKDFSSLNNDTNVCNDFVTGLDFLEHGADYETAISATGESKLKLCLQQHNCIDLFLQCILHLPRY